MEHSHFCNIFVCLFCENNHSQSYQFYQIWTTELQAKHTLRQTRTFQTLLYCTSLKPGWVKPSVYKLFRADSITELTGKTRGGGQCFWIIFLLNIWNGAKVPRKSLPWTAKIQTCLTRDGNILDHCYTIIKDAYHSVPRAALGLSDHCLVHLIPTYRQKLKSAKPVIGTVKRRTNEAEQDLKACFDLTDWSVLKLLPPIWTSSQRL